MIKVICDRCGRTLPKNYISTIVMQLGEYKYTISVLPDIPNRYTVDLCVSCIYNIAKKGELANGQGTQDVPSVT